MLGSPSWIVEAERAKEGVLLTSEVGANMGCFFFSMDEAGD